MRLRLRLCALVSLLVSFASLGAAAGLPPLTQNAGTWPTSHVQGIAVDLQGGYIYYSFTTLLAKYDFSGKLIGTLVGWAGHLGDRRRPARPRWDRGGEVGNLPHGVFARGGEGLLGRPES